jgi:pimeloyl-ACP methyl ester carboxylesterase
MAKFPALQPETPENDVTVQEENIFAPVKRRPQYFLGAVLVACILMLFCTPLPDQLILFPTTQRIDAHGAVRETIPFQNGELEIWTARSRLAQQRNRVDAYILRFYGNADRAERWVALEADAFGERAIGIWGMNYPGFGGSSGPARLKRMSPAGLAAFDVLKSKAGNHPIVVFGASIGSAVAMDVAANRSVRGLILHNPTPLRQIILRHYGWWNLWLLAGPVALQIPRELDSVANANRIHAPALFLLAENDEIVPPKFQRLVVDSFAGEKQVIILPGAHHNSPIEGAVVAEIHRAYDWLFDATATNEM